MSKRRMQLTGIKNIMNALCKKDEDIGKNSYIKKFGLSGLDRVIEYLGVLKLCHTGHA